MRFIPHAFRKPSASAAEGTHTLDDAVWPTQASATRVNLSPVAALLGVALIATLGVWGGAELQKRQAGSSPAASASGLDRGGSRRLPGLTLL